jgi:Tol biopolymer transport system component
MIGAGGMGEVYRAQDTRLNRDVAIKIAAERFSERFSREAQTIASLNHPNICHLYDVGPSYLVMELLEGQTLADRMRQGAIPVPEALEIARQIVDALDAAHEKGVVHRDLKPGNVVLKADGTVKVLDFGLAKTGIAGIAASTDSPTLTGTATEAGVILGTAAYMSPEQAKGRPVDRRADIWAFGVVLYEMVTGQRLFEGESTTEVLAGVLKEEPNWNLVPHPVKRLLRKCLQRDPQQRLRHIGDAMLLVDAGAPSALPVAPVIRTRSWLWPAIAAVLLLTTAGLAYSYVRLGAVPPPPANQTRFQIPAPVGATVFSLSPDGRRLAYFQGTPGSQTTQLWIRPMDSLDAHPVPGTDGATFTFWSPDSRFVAFASQGKLKKIDVSGGPAQTICDLAAAFRGGSWNQQGDIIFAVANRPLFKVSSGGGTPVPVTALNAQRAESAHFFPSFLPDGRHFVYLSVTGRVATLGVYSGSLDVKPEEQDPTLVVATNAGPVFTPASDGAKPQLLYLRDRSVVAQAIDTERIRLTGDAVPLADGVGSVVAGVGGASWAFFTSSWNGDLVYRGGGNGTVDISQLTWYGRDGKMLGAAGEPAPYQTMLLSPDQTRAAVVRNNDVWVVDLVRGTTTRLTTHGSIVQSSAVWSPDGSHLAYTASPKGALGVYRKASDGSGDEELLWKGDGLAGPSHWSPDGRFVAFTVFNPKTAADMWWVTADGDHKSAPFLHSEFAELAARFSPDGKWVAYYSDRSGQNEIYVQPFHPDDPSAPSPEFVISKGGAVGMPRWRGDGKEIYYLSRDNKFMAVEISSSPSFHAGEPKMLFPAPAGFVRGTTPGAFADASPDGKRFLMALPVALNTAQQQFTTVMNWTGLLKK